MVRDSSLNYQVFYLFEKRNTKVSSVTELLIQDAKNELEWPGLRLGAVDVLCSKSCFAPATNHPEMDAEMRLQRAGVVGVC